MEGIRSQEASHAFLNSGFFLWLSRQRAECQRENQISNRFSLCRQPLTKIFIRDEVNEVKSQCIDIGRPILADILAGGKTADKPTAVLLDLAARSPYQSIRSSIQCSE